MRWWVNFSYQLVCVWGLQYSTQSNYPDTGSAYPSPTLSVPFLLILGPKKGPIPNAKKIFFSQFLTKSSQLENFEKLRLKIQYNTKIFNLFIL